MALPNPLAGIAGNTLTNRRALLLKAVYGAFSAANDRILLCRKLMNVNYQASQIRPTLNTAAEWASLPNHLIDSLCQWLKTGVQ